METHKKKVDEELEDSNEKLKQREKTIEEQKEEIAHLTNSLNDAIKKYNELQQEKYNEDARKEKIIEDMET
jgi:chaperonin cofactor prefoldin